MPDYSGLIILLWQMTDDNFFSGPKLIMFRNALQRVRKIGIIIRIIMGYIWNMG